MATFLQLVDIPFRSQAYTHFYFSHPKGEVWISVDSNLAFNFTPPGGSRQFVPYHRSEGSDFVATYAKDAGGYPDPNQGLETSPFQASRGLMCINPKNVSSFTIEAFDGSGSSTYSVGPVTRLAPFRSFPDIILKMTLVHEGSGRDGQDGYDPGYGGGYDGGSGRSRGS